jgi:2-desacetyl-2-hydroxyethyl bacteriochlorophyllide A dehydrogenase
MKAAVLEDIRKIAYKEDYPNPEIGSNEVLVKVHYCGICGSDVTNFKYKMYQVPLIMGHEISGEIAKIGADVQNFKIGDKVIALNVKLDISQGKLEGLGIFDNGGFAEYVRVKKRNVFHIPDNVSVKEATMIESFANITRVIKISKMTNNEKVIIFGGGNIGLCFLNAIISERKPDYVIVIEPHKYLREKAIELGAKAAFPPNKMKIKKFTKLNGAPSFIFDTVGNENTILMAIDLIERGGTVSIEGIQKTSVSFPTFSIINKEICLRGCLGHDRDDILAAIELFFNKKVNPEKLISKIIDLKDLQNAFNEFLEPGERKFVKILVHV